MRWWSRALVISLVGLFAVAVLPANAQSPSPSDQASKGSFSALAIVVSDPNWQKKWNTPVEAVPEFTAVKRIGVGERGALLTFFSGATIKKGVVRLNCDVKVTTPDGVKKHPKKLCFESKRAGPSGHVYMTGLAIEFAPTAEDTPGLVRFDIGITDANSGVRLPLSVSFEWGGRK